MNSFRHSSIPIQLVSRLMLLVFFFLHFFFQSTFYLSLVFKSKSSSHPYSPHKCKIYEKRVLPPFFFLLVRPRDLLVKLTRTSKVSLFIMFTTARLGWDLYSILRGTHLHNSEHERNKDNPAYSTIFKNDSQDTRTYDNIFSFKKKKIIEQINTSHTPIWN